MNSPSLISVIIVNYNTVALLRECLDRLFASQLDRPFDVYVVDNGSTDGSLEMVRDEFPGVHTIAAGGNLGFAGGNNLAIQEILANESPDSNRWNRHVLLLNSDCFVEPDSIQRTAWFLDDHPEAGAVGPKLLLGDGRLDLACRRSFPTPASAFWKLTGLSLWFPKSRTFARYNLTYLDPDQTSEVDSVVGAYMHVRLAAIDDAGLLDDDFFMYGEDLDWAYRMKERGWKIYYYPGARALHYKGASSSRRSYRLIVEFYRAMYLFHRKHYAPRTFFALNLLVTVGIFSRAALALFLNLLRPDGKKRVA